VIYPQVNLAEWATTYDIVPIPATCRKCGEEQFFTAIGSKAFAHGKFRGLLSDHTKCGDEYRQSLFTYCTKQARMELATMVSLYTEDMK
jgi:hypothetical protein